MTVHSILYGLPRYCFKGPSQNNILTHFCNFEIEFKIFRQNFQAVKEKSTSTTSNSICQMTKVPSWPCPQRPRPLPRLAGRLTRPQRPRQPPLKRVAGHPAGPRAGPRPIGRANGRAGMTWRTPRPRPRPLRTPLPRSLSPALITLMW